MDLKERFTKAIFLIIGNTPPHSFIDELLLDKDPEFGYFRLQDWIVNQPNFPNWTQGITLLEAAMYIAEDKG